MDLFISVGIIILIVTITNMYVYFNYNKHKEEVIKAFDMRESILSKTGLGVLQTGRLGEINYMNDEIRTFLGFTKLPMAEGDPLDVLITRLNRYLDEEEALSSEDLKCHSGVKIFTVKAKGLETNITYYEIRVEAFLEEGDYNGQVISIKDVTSREVSSQISQAIIKISMNVAEFRTVEDVLKYFSQNMEEIIDIDYVFASLVEEEATTYFINHTEHSYSTKIIKTKQLHPLSAYAMTNKGSTLLNASDFEGEGLVDILSEYDKDPACLITSTIRGYNHDTKGAIGLLFNNEVAYPELVEESLKIIAGYIGQVVERLRIETQIHDLAYYDQLTTLPNRHMFINKLKQEIINVSLSGQKLLGLLFLDFSGIKRINDEYGHYVGDLLLKQLAGALIEGSKDMYFIGRLGGDEFGIFTTGTTKCEFEGVASHILEIIDQTWLVEGHQVHVTGNIGISIYKEDSIHPEELIHKADKALAEAKSIGKSQYSFFS